MSVAIKNEDKTTAENVIVYLKENPSFFLKHSNILTHMHLPNDDEGTVKNFSAFQAKKLKKKIAKYEERIHLLMNTALQNEKSSEDIHQFVLQILESTSLKTLKERITKTLKEEFKLDHVMFIEGETLKEQEHPQKTVKLKHTKAEDVLYTPSTTAETFAEAWLYIKTEEETKAIILLSSKDTQRFYEGKGDTLLTFLTEIITFAWKKLSESDPSK